MRQETEEAAALTEVFCRVEGSHSLIPLSSLSESPAALTALWPHITEFVSAAEVVDRLLTTGKGEPMTDQVNYQDDDALFEADGRRALAAESEARAKYVKEQLDREDDSEAKTQRSVAWRASLLEQDRRWSIWNSDLRRKQALAARDARLALAHQVGVLASEQREAEKAAAERAVAAVRERFAARVTAMTKAFDEGKPYWREVIR